MKESIFDFLISKLEDEDVKSYQEVAKHKGVLVKGLVRKLLFEAYFRDGYTREILTFAALEIMKLNLEGLEHKHD